MSRVKNIFDEFYGNDFVRMFIGIPGFQAEKNIDIAAQKNQNITYPFLFPKNHNQLYGLSNSDKILIYIQPQHCGLFLPDIIKAAAGRQC
jgi:hypothetical protein